MGLTAGHRYVNGTVSLFGVGVQEGVYMAERITHMVMGPGE